MNLLKLAIRAKTFITGKDRWITGERRQPHDDGGYAVCALGAIEMALGAKEGEAEQKGTTLVVRMAQTLDGTLSFKEWKEREIEDKKGLTDHWTGQPIEPAISYEDYVEYCAEIIMKNNDEGTQRSTQGMFTRIINVLKAEQAARRAKNTIKGLLTNALAGLSKEPVKAETTEKEVVVNKG